MAKSYQDLYKRRVIIHLTTLKIYNQTLILIRYRSKTKKENIWNDYRRKRRKRQTCECFQVEKKQKIGEVDRYLYFLATPQVGTHQFTCMKNNRVLVGQLPYLYTLFFYFVVSLCSSFICQDNVSTENKRLLFSYNRTVELWIILWTSQNGFNLHLNLETRLLVYHQSD